MRNTVIELTEMARDASKVADILAELENRSTRKAMALKASLEAQTAKPSKPAEVAEVQPIGDPIWTVKVRCRLLPGDETGRKPVRSTVRKVQAPTEAEAEALACASIGGGYVAVGIIA
jgi:hypothetical protein